MKYVKFLSPPLSLKRLKYFLFLFLAATSSSTGYLVGHFTKNSSQFDSHSFQLRRLEFVMEVKCVCDSVCFC